MTGKVYTLPIIYERKKNARPNVNKKTRIQSKLVNGDEAGASL
jgi:hypothetical protein